MSRYFTRPPADIDYDRRLARPRADWEDAEVKAPALPHPQVFVGEPVATGLVDKDGRPIYRLPDPIGFLKS